MYFSASLSDKPMISRNGDIYVDYVEKLSIIYCAMTSTKPEDSSHVAHITINYALGSKLFCHQYALITLL